VVLLRYLLMAVVAGEGERMQTKETDLEPVRERTDIGLDQERARTDAALDSSLLAEEKLADADIRQARALADKEQLRERRLADSILEQARDRADDLIRVEREERRVVDELLGLERAETDDRLRTERETTDDVVAGASVRLVNEQARSKRAVSGRDDFLAVVSHELRNPLSAIALGAQTLVDATVPGRDTTAIGEDIQIACAQMRRLVDDLLDGVSIEAGSLRVITARVDARRVLHDALAANALMLRRHGVVVTVDEPLDPLPARCDHARLMQVFANLFSNAVKFTPAGGRISVNVASADAAVLFAVADSGDGIPAGDLPQIFDRFWQGEARDRRGLGLGLYICKGIVEAHGGRIWACSEVGVGSTFFFTVPLPD
jgi:signal transduction histidine kinase